MLILSLLRLKSVSSHPSPAGGAGAGSLGLLGIKAGGAFSWSLRCSSCRTSSVFSLGNSPVTGVTFTILRETVQSHISITSESFQSHSRVISESRIPSHSANVWYCCKSTCTYSYPTMAAVCRVFCCGGVCVLVGRAVSVPDFSQS